MFNIFKWNKKKRKNILSIDGGGVRGLFSASILKKTKDVLNLNFTEDFDVIAGTSVGSIIAALLSAGIPIDEALEIFTSKVRVIFKKKPALLEGWSKSKYDSSGLKNVLTEILGDMKISDVKTNLFIPSINITKNKTHVFTNKDKNVKLVDAVMSSCAAPTYFDPYGIDNNLYIDGGLWANDPTIIAVMDVLGKGKLKLSELKILSIGAGYNTMGDLKIEKKEGAQQKKEWGIFQWNTNLIPLFQDLPTRGISSLMLKASCKENYLRLNFKADKTVSLDGIKEMNYLRKKVEEVYEKEKENIKYFWNS